MSKTQRKTYCYSDGEENAHCPNCGRPMKSVDYYSARPLYQQEVNRDWNSKTINTTYTDVNPHRGNICLFCAHEDNRGKRVAGMILLFGAGAASFIAMVAGLVLSNLAESNGGDIGAALGLPMALMCIFLLVAVAGLVIYMSANEFNPARRYTKEQLYLKFIKCLPPMIHSIPLASWQVDQMRKNR
ncbi:hypothetical protein DFR64_2679 [Pelolinea submarina]|uniref:Uncharacterized protein n=2 Tax=Pelolinea submarina TaxID=913107 RepID=A0A3E0A7M4_9CHLR|nr:hypothetical protein [Pelolinea submarina]REG06247.1 hypothetical protein DFR64_2679 [Pelolinea submarina]